MSNNMLNLLSVFSKIVNKKWIKGINNNKNSVGLTFERLIGKNVDSDFLPDYRDIEIKCSQRYSRFPIHLFDKAFDGPNAFETNEILKKYGSKYKIVPNKKYLKVDLLYNQDVLVNNKYKFRLVVSDMDKKIYIKIFDMDNKLIDEPYLDFDTVKFHLITKLSNLALIYASKIEKDSNKYYRYYSICFFKLKNFEKFIDLIKLGIVTLKLECRVSLSKDYGNQKNKGIEFFLPKEKIEMLFGRILDYNADKQEINYYEI
ncbi:MAG: hypothetical protein E7172_01260 [Firmicutes bacterium]|nr:hypothetical protein [Bacillota bacterium]